MHSLHIVSAALWRGRLYGSCGVGTAEAVNRCKWQRITSTEDGAVRRADVNHIRGHPSPSGEDSQRSFTASSADSLQSVSSSRDQPSAL